MTVAVIQGAFSSIPRLQCRMNCIRHRIRLLRRQFNAKFPTRKSRWKSLLQWKISRQIQFPTSRLRSNLPHFFPLPEFLLLPNDRPSDWLQLLLADVVNLPTPPKGSQRILRRHLKRQQDRKEHWSPILLPLVVASPNVSRMRSL